MPRRMEAGLHALRFMASEGFHESSDLLRPETRDMHRALTSLMEELEAIDWYGQRVDATGDATLREIIAHNRNEEQEHAAMLLEWIRRRDPDFDRHLRVYLFTEGSILRREAAITQGGETNGARPATSVGSLREKR
jgi:uncharacterized protein